MRKGDSIIDAAKHTEEQIKAIPDYPAALIGTFFGVLFAGGSLFIDVPAIQRPQPQIWAIFFLPFVIAICYFGLTEHELETKRYRSLADALSPRCQFGEYLFRILLASFFGVVIALPLGIFPEQIRSNAFQAGGTLNELELRLILLAFCHMLLLTWDLLVLFLQNPQKKSIVTGWIVLGDTFGGTVCCLTVLILGRLGGSTHETVAAWKIAVVALLMLTAYWKAVSKVGYVFRDIFLYGLAAIGIGKLPNPSSEDDPSNLSPSAMLAWVLGAYIFLSIMIVATVFESLNILF